MIWLYVYLVSSVVSISVLYWMGSTAPLGEETSNGFKYITEEKQ